MESKFFKNKDNGRGIAFIDLLATAAIDCHVSFAQQGQWQRGVWMHVEYELPRHPAEYTQEYLEKLDSFGYSERPK